MSLAAEVEALFSGRAEPRVRPVPGRSMYGPSSDDDEPEGSSDTAYDLEGLSIEILYRDTRGDPSVRTIRCNRLRRQNGLLYIDADCTLRRAPRTFRLDRIVEIRDYSTGEVIDDVVGFFSEYIDEDIEPPQPRSARVDVSSLGRRAVESAFVLPQTNNPRVAAAFRDGARVLLFLALSDGELHETERALILDYATGRLLRLSSPPANPEAIALRWINNQVPTRAAAMASLGRVTARDDDAREIAHKMIDVLLADGTASDGEMASAWALVQVLENRERVRPLNSSS